VLDGHRRGRVHVEAIERGACAGHRGLATLRPDPGRCVSIFLDENSRYTGKSQSEPPPHRTQATPHHDLWPVVEGRMEYGLALSSALAISASLRGLAAISDAHGAMSGSIRINTCNQTKHQCARPSSHSHSCDGTIGSARKHRNHRAPVDITAND
jgi:hypothetical protein